MDVKIEVTLSSVESLDEADVEQVLELYDADSFEEAIENKKRELKEMMHSEHPECEVAISITVGENNLGFE